MLSHSDHVKGFTLIELIVVIGVFVIILGSGAIAFGRVISGNALKFYGNQLVQDLREVRTASATQKRDSAWGVYFDDLPPVYGYTVFKGQDYASRDASFDRSVEFPKVLTISWLNFGGPKEVAFGQSAALPDNPGFLILTAENRDFIISINALGNVEYEK